MLVLLAAALGCAGCASVVAPGADKSLGGSPPAIEGAGVPIAAAARACEGGCCGAALPARGAMVHPAAGPQDAAVRGRSSMDAPSDVTLASYEADITPRSPDAPADARDGSPAGIASGAAFEEPIYRPAFAPPVADSPEGVVVEPENQPAYAGRSPMVPRPATLDALEDRLRGSASETDQARLRLLLLAAGRRDEALTPLVGTPAERQEFWSQELLGLDACLDEARTPDPRRRAGQAAGHLHAAAAALGRQGALAIRNLAFCTEVRSFGMYDRVERAVFHAGEKVFLYWEVENFTSDATPEGYRTALRSGYTVVDAGGRAVDEHQFPAAEEICRNRRRDYFICYYLWLPEQAAPGRYTLRLATTDALGGETAQGAIEFEIVSDRSTNDNR
jgi:hypothetical protein